MYYLLCPLIPLDPEANEEGVVSKSDVPGGSETVDKHRQAMTGLLASSMMSKPARSETFMMTGAKRKLLLQTYQGWK
jgi:hypothetical protein